MQPGKTDKMSKIVASLTALIIALTLTFGAYAAGDPTRAQGYLDDARKSIEKRDLKSAVIQLKNAVQADPDNGAARYQLGLVELQLGDLLSAEKEFRSALDLNFDRDRVTVALADT